MPEMSRYDHGVPSWVDMGAPDPKAAATFYGQLFGWEAEDQGEEMGHYHLASKGGKLVAGIGPAQDPGPPHWTMYTNVDDIDSLAKAIEANGGKVLAAPFDVATAGRMAVFADTTGAVSAGWQAKDMTGAQLVNEPGTFTWSELHTSNLEKAKQFYSDVFGWGWGGPPEYAEVQVNGRTVAAAMTRNPEMPAEVPDNWLIYFGSDNLEADVEKATTLGATVTVPPTAIPNTGRFAILVDPQGAAFALFQS
jgi:predicted enzyme related to lactoylglutathione lyase